MSDRAADQLPHPPWRQRLRILGWMLVPTGLAIMAGVAAQTVLPRGETTLIFILAVFLAAATGGLWPGIVTAVLSSLAYDFFFLDPLFSFSIADPAEVFALTAFLCMAVLTGSLAGRLRDETDTARRRAATLRGLYDVVGQLSGARSLDPLLEAAIDQIAAAAGGSAVLLRADRETWTVRASAPGHVELTVGDLQAAESAARSIKALPAVAPGFPGSPFEFRPLVVRDRPVAVIGFAPFLRTQAAWHDADQAVLALFRQITLAADRIVAEEEGARARAAVEEERLRSALLSSLSHDLRTPLATILGSITSLRQLGQDMSAADRDELMAVAQEEAERLSRFVANLLHMTRLEAGIDLRREWIDVADVVRAAVDRARTLYPGRLIDVTLQPETDPIQADGVLLEQVVLNLIDNALHYSPNARPIEVGLKQSGAWLSLSVLDDGPGIPEAELARIFDRFYRGAQSEGHPAGAGLGLAICRGIVTALGGTIGAESPVSRGRGTRMLVTLPAPESTLDLET